MFTVSVLCIRNFLSRAYSHMKKDSWLQIIENELKLQSGTLFSDPYRPFVVTVLPPTPPVAIEGLSNTRALTRLSLRGN